MQYQPGQFEKFSRYGRVAQASFMALFSSQMNPITFMLDFYIYPLVIFISVGFGVYGTAQEPLWHGPALFLASFICWTLVEYFMHRYIFHHLPGVMGLHLAHHKDADEMIGTPTLLSLALIFGLAYLPMVLLIGEYNACFWFAGMCAGYLAFGGIHFIVHHFDNIEYAFVRKLKRAHAIHHYGKMDYNFGVTTLFWDRVFGTYSDKMR